MNKIFKMKFAIQVKKEHYFQGYDTKERWASYWYQINEVLKTKPKKVLEIGIGNKTVANYLKNQGIKVTTVDIDKNLEPDFVGSVTELSKIFKKNSFDTSLCAQVLEHLPFKYFEASLSEINKITKKYFIFSLPYHAIYLSLSLKIPLFKRKYLVPKMPLFFIKYKKNGLHYWEVGTRNYPLKKIRKSIKKYFYIEKEYSPPENPGQRFFILRIL